MSASTRPSLSLVACLAESTPGDPSRAVAVDMASPGTPVPTPAPSPDGPDVDVGPTPAETTPAAPPAILPCLEPAGVLLVVADSDDLAEDDEVLANLLFERGNFS
jgi:hypothetical protein